MQKYQTDDQRKVIYEGKLPKGDLQKVIYEGKLRKGDLQKVLYEGKLQKVTYKIGTPPFWLNTPRAPTGPERIKVAYGKVPLRARWERELCKGREPFRKGAPSISLRVFCGSGCVKSRKFRENKEKHYFLSDFRRKYRKGTKNDATRRPK